jgi:hypothetical protein
MCREFQPGDRAILAIRVRIVKEEFQVAGSIDSGRWEGERWFQVREEGATGTRFVPLSQLRSASEGER